jgi:ATP-dependent helicase IRC3
MGRGMRLSPATGKEDCHIIDFVDTVKRIGVVSTPTLFGLEPDDPIEGISSQRYRFPQSTNSLQSDETPESLEARASEKAGASLQQDASHVPNPTSITYEDYDDPFALVNNAAGSPHVNLLSRNAWVSCGGDVYILECIGKGFIKVQEVDGTCDFSKSLLEVAS